VTFFQLRLPFVRQGWVFAMAKTIFCQDSEKNGKNRGKNSGVRISFHYVSIS